MASVNASCWPWHTRPIMSAYKPIYKVPYGLKWTQSKHGLVSMISFFDTVGNFFPSIATVLIYSNSDDERYVFTKSLVANQNNNVYYTFGHSNQDHNGLPNLHQYLHLCRCSNRFHTHHPIVYMDVANRVCTMMNNQRVHIVCMTVMSVSYLVILCYAYSL